MGKAQKRARPGRKTTEPVKSRFGMDLPAIDPSRRNTLILTSVGTKILVAIMTPVVFGSFLDMFDYGNYYLAIQNILSGMWPWANGSTVYYPPLAFVPMLIAYGGSLFGGTLGFVALMWVVMAICDIVTVFCVYYIGLKIYREQTAFVAAMLCATAFSAAYFALTKYDAFPVSIAAVALLATVYARKNAGYLATIIGLFVKLWPMVLFPFLWIYNARDSSIWKEGKERAIWFLLAACGAFGLMILAGYNKFLEYTDLVYCNTIPYLMSRYLQIANLAIPTSAIIAVFRVLIIVAVAGALYWMYRRPGSVPRMLKMILLVLFVLVFFIQYRSPQYSFWLLPFFALLVAGDLPGVLAFYGVQVLAYIEFPLAFGVLYVNDHYLNEWAMVFFTLLFVAYGLLLWRALKAPEPPGAPAGKVDAG